MEYHKYASIFPLDEAHIEELAEDIKKNGQIVPIELLDGKILDGRRRWMACERAEIKAITRVVETDDPIAYVVSLNYHRRQLTISQRGMCVVCADEFRQEREELAKKAKERMEAGGKVGGTLAGKGRSKAIGVGPVGPTPKSSRTNDELGQEGEGQESRRAKVWR